jgi:hypothetical protein
MVWEWMIYTAIALLIIIVAYEFLRDRMITEGFTDGDKQIPEFFSRFFPKRYDVVPGQTREEDGWVRNPRYFEGYTDVQRLGYKADFCRVIEKEGEPDTRIMACALAGQEGIDSMVYRTESARSGMRFGRDDYFRDVNNDRRDAYCRILKVEDSPNDRWEARCVPGGLTRFKEGVELQDTAPPSEIQQLLTFFEGAMVWYRWFDDMMDYAENSRLMIAGGAKVDETPRRTKTDGLRLNSVPGADFRELPVEGEEVPPADQFIKIGENDRMEFDSQVNLRNTRAISVWAYFDEFTNNARILDFGNGAGKDNVILGILGRGNQGVSQFGRLADRPSQTNKVCQQRAPSEVSPQDFLAATKEYCSGPEPIDSTFPEDQVDKRGVPPTANLLFEIWDSQQRKMRLVVNEVIPYRRWVHIAVTTVDMEAFRPTWHVYIDGKKVHEHTDGHLPMNSYTTLNYIGRSNWEGVTSQYDDRDERFRGALFDFRMYRIPMSASKINSTWEWGRSKIKMS